MASKFSDEVLQPLRDARTVHIETSSRSGAIHRTIIWVVVDGDDVFVRSWRGARARWFRELTRTGEGALILRRRDRIPVRAIAAVDEESVTRCSRGFEEKYRGNPSTPAMVDESIANTTLRLEPA